MRLYGRRQWTCHGTRESVLAEVLRIRESIHKRAEDRREFLSLSVDATLRCCMPLMGQASYRAPAAVRNQAASPDDESWRRVLTVRGRTGPGLRWQSRCESDVRCDTSLWARRPTRVRVISR